MKNEEEKRDDEIGTIIETAAEEFGAVFGSGPRMNVIKRDNRRVNTDSEDGKAKFIALIGGDQEPRGRYEGLSLVVFPSDHEDNCLVTIAVGSGGLGGDFELASKPGLRRGILKLQKSATELGMNADYARCKYTFIDIESKMDGILPEDVEDENINNAIKEYGKLILASQYIKNIKNDKNNIGFKIIVSWVAHYAEYREWSGSKKKLESIKKAKALNGDKRKPKATIEGEIERLMFQRNFVVLCGAPGTGKTYHAMELAKKWEIEKKIDKWIFTQFHAETSYSDFVCGITPALDTDVLKYKTKEGPLYEALSLADEGKKILLVIDEINRANLSNVLGESMYLFEKGGNNLSESDNNNEHDIRLKIGGKMFRRMPENLFVIATMNTSDRSLAVIDFALRRRFAWYTIKPHAIPEEELNGKKFHEDVFDDFARIFEKYATDEELSLQPGQSYFITDNIRDDSKDRDPMKDRLIYELMPLIKEYLQEGLMMKAKNEFCNLFFTRCQCNLYE